MSEPDDELPANEPHAESDADLGLVERDLADVEAALARLQTGEYWNDEVTGDPLPLGLLEQHPTARRAHPPLSG